VVHTNFSADFWTIHNFSHRYIFLSFKWSFFQLHCVSKTPLIFVCVTTRWKSSSCNDASYTTFQGNFDNWRKIFCCTNLESDKSDFSIGCLAGRCLTAVSAQITVVHIDVCIRPGATTNYILTKIKCNTHQPNLCADNLYMLDVSSEVFLDNSLSVSTDN